MDYYHGRLWPDVTCPIARRVLVEAFNIAPIDAEDHFYDIYKFQSNSGVGNVPLDRELEDYRRQLRSLLEQSDLVTRLLDPWWIEAVFESLAQPWRGWLMLFRPHDAEGSVRHFTNHLDWYLGLDDDPKPSLTGPIIMLSTLFAVILIVTYLFATMGSAGLQYIVPILAASSMLFLVFAGISMQGLSKKPAMHVLIARAEFYLYLRNALRDNTAS